VEAHSIITTFQELGQKKCDPFHWWASMGNFLLKIKIKIKSMPMVFLECSTRRPLDIVNNDLVVISIGDIWVGFDVLH
jgi:hypothetical protein